MVETYINTCNAYNFLGYQNEAIQCAERAIEIAEIILSDLGLLMQDSTLKKDQKEFYEEQYHYQINLKSNIMHTLGQIFEKAKDYQGAL